MINDFDVDLEELESRLYSQVYHTNVDDYEKQDVFPNESEKINLRLHNTRYFQKVTLKEKCFDNDPSYISIESNDLSNSADITQQRSKPQASDFFNKISGRNINSPQVSVENQIPQIVHMINPCNNILILPQVPTQIIAHSDYVNSRQIKKNFEKFIDRQTRRQEKKQEKSNQRKRKKLLKKQKNIENFDSINSDTKEHDFNVHYLNSNGIPLTVDNQTDNIVTISDSDDSCVEISEQQELIVLSSDESDGEKKSKIDINDIKKESIQKDSLSIEIKTDDKLNESNDLLKVLTEDNEKLFIDHTSKNSKVIEIDCDSKSVTNIEDNKVNSDISVETSSTNFDKKSDRSDDRSISLIKQKAVINSKERSELLRTPDSILNDFLDSTLDLQQQKFNFGLHGADFGNGHNFLKPKSHLDICETESSCSASDNSTPIKNTVFHEVEFETPNKELFDETNLETFGNYITPNRNNKPGNALPNNKLKQIPTKASIKLDTQPSCSYSDSSSESDYNGGDEECLPMANKKLPFVKSPEYSSDKILECNRSIADDNYSNKRGKDISSENSVPKKKVKNSDIRLESSVSNTVSSDEFYKCQKNLQTKQAREESTNEEILGNQNVNVGTSQVYYISDDDEISACKDFETNTQAVNSKVPLEASQKISEQKRITGFSKYWTNDMHKFNNTSWGLENFSVEEIQKSMSGNSDLWRIIDRDRNHFRLGTPKGLRCHRCREMGHVALNCPNGIRPTKCSLCGQIGHLEPRCPNALCTLCGSPGGFGTYCSYCASWKYIQCKICYMFGHIDTKCPDLWRRYHLTTQPGPIVKPLKQNHKLIQDRWCSGCTKSGHYEYKCRFYTRSHHSVDPYVKDYTDLYGFPKSQPFLIHRDFADSTHPSDTRAQPIKSKEANSSNVKMFDDTELPKTPEIRSNDFVDGQQVDVVNVEESKSIENNIHVSLDNFIFPSIEMIPLYFHEQMGINNKNTNNNVNYIFKDSDITKNTAAANSVVSQNLSSTQNISNRYSSTHLLNYKLFAFTHSTKGINFINEIRRQPSISIIINKDDDDDDNDKESPGGTMTICGNTKEVREAVRQLQTFFSSAPKLKNIPKFSKAAYNLLSPKLEKLERTVGNCKSLYGNLTKLQLHLTSGKATPYIRKKIKEIKLHLNMLLFGKLRLGDGQKHIDILQYWQKRFEERDNYKIPLNILYDLFDSYSYIFLDIVNHDYKFFCGIYSNDKRLLSTKTSSKDTKCLYKYFKLVETKCHKFNMLDKLHQLNHLKSAVYRSNFSAKAFKEFMTFCRRVLHSSKTHYS